MAIPRVEITVMGRPIEQAPLVEARSLDGTHPFDASDGAPYAALLLVGPTSRDAEWWLMENVNGERRATRRLADNEVPPRKITEQPANHPE